MNIKEWSDEIEGMTKEEISKYSQALETLKSWKPFEDNFGHGKSLVVLRNMFSAEQTTRDFREEENKIDPNTDTLESALIKKGISPKVTKAILSGYEGIFEHHPISISLNSKESFYGRDLLIKTLMVFENRYEAWNNDLFFIDTDDYIGKVQSLLNEANEAVEAETKQKRLIQSSIRHQTYFSSM